MSRARDAKPQNGSLYALPNARGVFHWTPNAGGSGAMPQGAMEARAPLGEGNCSPQAKRSRNAQTLRGAALLGAVAVTPQTAFCTALLATEQFAQVIPRFAWGPSSFAG